MHSKFYSILILCVCGFVYADPIPAPVIDKVTVFSDRAVVSRKGKVALKKGLNQLSFDGFSANLIDVSIRAKIDGGDAKVLNVSSWVDKRKEIQDEEVKKLDDALKEKHKAMAELSQKINKNAIIEQYLKTYINKLRTAISEQTLSANPEIEKWRNSLKLLNEKEKAVTQEKAALNIAYQRLGQDIGLSSRRLNVLENPQARAVRIVDVSIDGRHAVLLLGGGSKSDFGNHCALCGCTRILASRNT